jgi:CRISPR-associated endonuclease/helicase Cas3
MQKQLLAKSLTYGELTLEQHLIDTENAALAIFKDRILDNWCRFLKVKDTKIFIKHLRIAALFHDIGKANAEFDALVRGGKKQKQALRHEWVSAFVLHLPSVRSWLEKSDIDLEIITASVLCHHLQASRAEWGKSRSQVKEVEFYFNNSQVKNILTKIAEIVDIQELPELPEKWIKGDNFWEKIYQDANRIGAKFSREVRRDLPRNALLLAVKAGLIAADSAASGIFRVHNSSEIEQWINEILHQNSITSEEIEEKILQPRYRQIQQKTQKEFKLKSFQEKAVKLSSRLLLLSGCGTGKTIFAYKWMQGVLKDYQVGHIIFLYPTRGTATEGFKDYVSWCPEAEASLLTGTAKYELESMAENPTESTKDKDFTSDERFYSLGFWGKRFFSATVDQFLSFLTHNYGGICLLPVLADSVVVIDEIHSFSKGMFDNLVSFLEHFDIPVLCMTATLPLTRKQDLTEKLEKRLGLGLQVFPTQDRSELKELEEAENKPRYQIQSVNVDTAYQRAIQAYQGEKRVLWVANTVNRCREIATALEDELNVEVLTYHSRFKLKDRQQRHTETVNAFALKQGERKPAIAVTTQVCEMSLDLDADVLITEIAPISALVQRFGRSNRHGLIEQSQIWVYEPSDILPYTKEEMEKTREFLANVLGTTSQKILAEKLEEYSPPERFADGSSSFVTSGYWATSEQFRDIDNYSINAVLDGDLDEIQKILDKRESIDGFILPIPKKFALENVKDRLEKLPRYLAIASSQFYSEKRGFGA